jgi:hypothetical protein
MLLTPTFVSLLLAGAAFWTLIWAATHKLDEIPCLECRRLRCCLDIFDLPALEMGESAPDDTQRCHQRH